MLYALAHLLRDHCPWIWEAVEGLDSLLFALRYGRRLRGLDTVLKHYQGVFAVEQLKAEEVPALALFFHEQPEEAFTFFHPHGFDEKTLRRLQRRRSFLAFVVKEENAIVGYFFLRCYFMGKCFRGYMVDYRQRNRGIGKLTSRVMTGVAAMLAIPSYGTIAPENVASMRSQNATVLRQLANGDYYVEYK